MFSDEDYLIYCLFKIRKSSFKRGLFVYYESWAIFMFHESRRRDLARGPARVSLGCVMSGTAAVYSLLVPPLDLVRGEGSREA